MKKEKKMMNKSTEIQNSYLRSHISLLKVDIDLAIQEIEDGFSQMARSRLLNALEQDWIIRKTDEEREKNLAKYFPLIEED